MMKGTDLLDSFWRLCEEQRGYPDENFENDFPQKEIFNSNMKELLTVKETYTSQEGKLVIREICVSIGSRIMFPEINVKIMRFGCTQ